jgi:hypothetical protein
MTRIGEDVPVKRIDGFNLALKALKEAPAVEIQPTRDTQRPVSLGQRVGNFAHVGHFDPCGGLTIIFDSLQRHPGPFSIFQLWARLNVGQGRSSAAGWSNYYAIE